MFERLIFTGRFVKGVSSFTRHSRKVLLFSAAAFAVCAMADPSNDPLRIIARSTGGFSNRFLKTVVESQPGNLISSPLSAQVVLAMAAYGAGGSTATQMRTSLGIPANNALGQSGYKSLIETLNAVKGVQLKMANKIYTSDMVPIKASYKEITAVKFLAETESLDFGRSATAAASINAWCDEQTNHRIKDVVTADSLTPDTALVLVNAVYFKGNWATKFDSTQTEDRPFHVDAKTIINVPTMYIKRNYRFGNIPEVDAKFIEIPYEGKELSMIIIRPNQIDGLKRIQDNLHTVNLTDHLKRSYSNEVMLYLPKFKIETTLDLKPSLEKMGMSEMFQNGADFSGMADAPLKISKVIQKAFIEVNEEGSEAAAVTGLSGRRSFDISKKTTVLNVNRPFILFLRQAETVPIIAGQVRDPRNDSHKN
ncbi:antichymotrypsin-2-like isoform X3 [Neodiprion fabricii]|uniref:antichymotrypsin-2-like isoform X3 n=1 Tax=Neodiprion fabricii TaxID=2872261 RepID=UPI001ED90CCE|nr:antichymotrypsin-2-like isoform X3 [Neodiprion fabricii]